MLKNVAIVILLFMIVAGIYKVTTDPQIKAAIMHQKTMETNVTRQNNLPGNEEAVQLVRKSIQNFSLSLKQGSMACFYNNLSDFWKQKTSVAKLNQAFAPFIKNRIDLSGLTKLQPVIEKGSGLLKNGDLLLQGHYNASNAVLQFREVYHYENMNGWGLSEFFVKILPKQKK